MFALSSGMPPAAIGVVRISGPAAGAALKALAGRLPTPRHASLAALKDVDGAPLDNALILWFPGPATATGEDLAELHLHGGRAVVAAVKAALGAMPGVRPAVAGEFTRRAFDNGRIDLAEAEGLADLLAAETESQRVQALGMASGHVSRAVERWQDALLTLMAGAEAELNFADEDDVETGEAVARRLIAGMGALSGELGEWLARPAAEVIAGGLSVVIAGPPNAGKSTLINALAQRELAIVSPVAGTTRDVIETPLALDGIAMRFSDTAGLRAESADDIEMIGIDRAKAAVEAADIMLWLGPPKEAPDHPRTVLVAAQADRWRGDAAAEAEAAHCDLILSAATGEGMDKLHKYIVEMARTLLPREGEAALRRRQRAALAEAQGWLTIEAGSIEARDLILLAERLRLAGGALDRITGRAGVEDMLDTLFGRFCIGK
ncbi:tRNA uridine-5-carboxymethylaminomethyl(34) synthesis GTPase MnmE [Sphingopyxis sp.]|uniref:tRNA uridine-5-carboxymethylaminomethyl(34) synthesis GTPase MnmE n=1 Tax=Sphingopyxis sp. TaxID=1908224 RepID=UPI002B48CEC3|nr:tRNA uridine-5-carboxymethylaminomethyl(34) synthesis GTPase MnmE [Sphingopyxis sp.]HJS13104.1 tRNA uridine-5-carboxymethylaminomethyl(34) synthesis GTPase MnmE [Sphingopyxis sp.]